MAALNLSKRLNDWKQQLKGLDPTAVLIGSAGAVALGFGTHANSVLGVGFGAAGLTFAATRFLNTRQSPAAARRPAPTARTSAAPVAASCRETPDDTAALAQQMLAQGRYALLLRPEIAPNLDQQQLRAAAEAMEEAMALVPAGEVALGRWGDGDATDDEAAEDAPPLVVQVEQFFLDRYPVTNREFYEFVAAGGYEEMAIWDPEIWPGVLEFVDLTGYPGPRFWKNGRYDPQRENHPVVGVSWYEAAAYARWVGKRLPTGAEWEKAGSWPVNLSAGSRPQRRYPWGDLMDRKRANLWGSGPNDTVPVDQFGQGISVGGIHQLIGNVWEWTSSSFGNWSQPGRELLLPTPMKTIRGGAFDTYFDNQATCQFQSGDDPIARKHNIGFRCALSVCDLAGDPTATGIEVQDQQGLEDGNGPRPAEPQATVEAGVCA